MSCGTTITSPIQRIIQTIDVFLYMEMRLSRSYTPQILSHVTYSFSSCLCSSPCNKKLELHGASGAQKYGLLWITGHARLRRGTGYSASLPGPSFRVLQTRTARGVSWRASASDSGFGVGYHDQRVPRDIGIAITRAASSNKNNHSSRRLTCGLKLP